jgi:hypothetical protein
MADYYTKFSFIVVLDTPEQQRYALDLVERFKNLTTQENPEPGDLPEELLEYEEYGLNCTVEPDGTTNLWIVAEEGCDTGSTCALVHHLLKHFNLEGYVAFDWANDCSKPRLDAFSGGAAYITAQEVITHHTADWVNDMIDQHGKSMRSRVGGYAE